VKDRFEKILFLLPAIGIVAFLSFFPFVFSLVLTFMSWDFSKLDAGMEFNGVNNFLRLFTDARFVATTKNTLLYVGVGVPLQYLVALGLAVTLCSVFLFDDRTPFPGLAALVPVVGAVLMIVAGTGSGLMTRSLGTPVMRLIGNVSYSWYLWHWPVYLALDGERTGLHGYSLAALRVAVTCVGSARSSSTSTPSAWNADRNRSRSRRSTPAA